MKRGSVLGAALLVAGTTIGAGMLALPTVLGPAGFLPSILSLVLFWALGYFCGQMFIDATLAFDEPVNLLTLSRRSLGKTGEILCWVLYLALLYSLVAAYLSGSHVILSSITAVEPSVFLVIFGAVIAMGAFAVDWVNRLFMLGLVIAYVFLIADALPELNWQHLQRSRPSLLWTALPTIVTSFGYQIIIPSLATYLQRNRKRIRQAVLWGSLAGLIVYLLFQAIILGSVPIPIIEEALRLGQPIVHSDAALAFSFFAIITSLLGVSLSLRDFLQDALRIQNKAVAVALTFLPPLLFAVLMPRAFLLALGWAGIIVCLLLGLLPVALVWRKRQWRWKSIVVIAGYSATILLDWVQR